MTNQLITFMKLLFLVNKTDGYLVPAAHLGEECKDDRECHQKDPNSYCSFQDQHLLCACKINYHISLINNTEKCIYGEPAEEEKEGLTAAPIILCFMGCVVIEALCLLAFRYWKKHRRSEFTTQGTLQLQAISFTDPRYIQGRRGHVISFMITPEMESVISGARSSSPPPYSQTSIAENMATQEEPPPPYEEAIKQCQRSKTFVLEEKKSQRKMSC